MIERSNFKLLWCHNIKMTHPGVGVSFNNPPLLLKCCFQMALYFQSVDNNPLKISDEKWQAFLKSLYLYCDIVRSGMTL